jgi:YD repeat-containing protein
MREPTVQAAFAFGKPLISTWRGNAAATTGAVISVCEVTNAAGSGTCGQNTALPSPGTACLTTYTFSTTTLNSVVYPSIKVTQNAQSSSQQTRLYVYDLMGRLIQETNPETGNQSPGTTSYYFDSDPKATCLGTYNGDLVKKIDNRGNTTCYTYDSLHRVQTVAYTSSSPDYASTPAKTLVYDAASYGSTAMSNERRDSPRKCIRPLSGEFSPGTR